jgi:hypothetical protein
VDNVVANYPATGRALTHAARWEQCIAPKRTLRTQETSALVTVDFGSMANGSAPAPHRLEGGWSDT